MSTEEKIIHDYLTSKKSKRMLAKKYGYSVWKIRKILQKAPARYFCQTCNKPLSKQNTRYCSKECFYQNKRKQKNCSCCNAPLNGRKNVKFCDQCSANRTTQSYKDLYKKRRNYLLELKGNKCEKCSYDTCTAALHFHHRDRKTKKFMLCGSSIVGHTWSSIMTELNKCDLLCANCHIELEEKIKQPFSKDS